jgi:hypothetical protein
MIKSLRFGINMQEDENAKAEALYARETTMRRYRPGKRQRELDRQALTYGIRRA